MNELQSNEILAKDIAYIKSDILEIKKKLDTKYVSHETFDLIIKSMNDLILSNKNTAEEADTRIIKTAMFIVTPMYVAVIGLLIKMFTN